MYDKKTWIIISLSLVVIILVVINITGNSNTKVAFEQIRNQLDQSIRSNNIAESELTKSIGENTQLEADNIELRNDNTELEQIINDLTGGIKKTKDYLNEYGSINTDFASFIQQNEPVEHNP